MPQLRKVIRKVIQEHVTDEHHEHPHDDHDRKLKNGKVPAVSEPYGGYVEGMAIAHVEEQVGGLDFDEYAEFAAQYGYTSEADLDQLEEWWEAAIAQSRGYSFGDGFGDGYDAGPRKNNTRYFNEAWSPERGFYAKEEDLPIYHEELEKLSHVKSHRALLNMMVKAIEARGLKWDVHTFEAAAGVSA